MARRLESHAGQTDNGAGQLDGRLGCILLVLGTFHQLAGLIERRKSRPSEYQSAEVLTLRLRNHRLQLEHAVVLAVGHAEAHEQHAAG